MKIGEIILYEYKVSWGIIWEDPRYLAGHQVSSGSTTFFTKPDKRYNGTVFYHKGRTVHEVYIPIASWRLKSIK